jgi:transposase
MFRGFTGFIQADANSVYDAVFRGQALGEESSADPPKEVGCWSHARRGFWECAVSSKEDDARQALLRIARMFDEEQKWADIAPESRRKARERTLRPLVDERHVSR